MMVDLLIRYPRTLVWVLLIATAVVAVTAYQLGALQ